MLGLADSALRDGGAGHLLCFVCISSKGDVGLLALTYFVTVAFVILPMMMYLPASPPCCQGGTS